MGLCCRVRLNGAVTNATSSNEPAASTLLPAAVLWDLDGTLIDSEPYWMAEETALVESYGGVWTEELAAKLVGSALLDSADFIRANSLVTMEPYDIVETLQAGVVRRLGKRIPWRPGARELLAALREAEVPCALVTMSWRPMVDAVVAQLPGMFAATLSGDEVTNGKPHPEPYLLGAQALGVPIEDCIAIEDSETGVASAYASGAATIAVPLVVDPKSRPGLAKIPTLAGLTPSDLVAITDRARRT